VKWDENDLATKMEAILFDEQKRKTFGINAKQTAIDKWNYSIQAQKMKEFYERLLQLGKRY
jgi:spore maturation protein CgeB